MTQTGAVVSQPLPIPSASVRPSVVLLSVMIVILLVASAVGVADNRSTSHHVTAARPPTAPTTNAAAQTSTSATLPTKAAAGPVEAFVPVAQAFVEQHRGLKYKNPVQVTTLDDAAFRQRLLSDESTDKSEIEKTTKILRALGLIPKNTDVAKAEESLLGDAVAGFYDPKTKALVVRGVKLTPYVRQVMVHELTHALQDQWFGIDRPDIDKANDEQPDGFQALVEGDAVRVDGEYRASLPRAEQRQAEQEENSQAGGVDASVPPVLIELLTFPYQVGPDFTRALLRAGGTSRLDAAFGKPPTTTEQLLHPEKFLAGEGAKPAAAPNADRKTIDTGVLGEFGLGVVLEQGISDGTLSADDVQRASTGWGGDQYVAWDQGSSTCVRDGIVMDTPQDQDELFGAFKRFATTRRGVSVSASGSEIVVTSCG